ncbi:hypothetical protein T265_13307, partial [Opisthorchis viverrini]
MDATCAAGILAFAIEFSSLVAECVNKTSALTVKMTVNNLMVFFTWNKTQWITNQASKRTNSFTKLQYIQTSHRIQLNVNAQGPVDFLCTDELFWSTQSFHNQR